MKRTVKGLNVIEVENVHDREGEISSYKAKANYTLIKTQDEQLFMSSHLEATRLKKGGVDVRVVFMCRPLKYVKAVELGTRPDSFSSGHLTYSEGLILEGMSRGKVFNDIENLLGRGAHRNEN